MFTNRSFTVVVALALLGVVTLIFGTATSTPTATPSAIGASDWFERHPVAVDLSRGSDLSDYYQRHLGSLTAVDLAGASDWFERHPVTAPNPARPRDYATLKDAQLEQRDVVQFGSVSIKAAGEEESYLAVQKEQRAMQKELRAEYKSAFPEPSWSGQGTYAPGPGFSAP